MDKPSVWTKVAYTDIEGSPYLYIGVQRYKLELLPFDKLEEALRGGADVNEWNDEIKNDPLHSATQSGDEDLIELLIKHGSELNTLDGEGNSALHLASSVAVAELLLEAGADPNVRSGDGTPVLHQKTSIDDVEIAYTLIEWGADVNSKTDFGMTPLHVACYENCPETARMLVEEAGADVTIKTENGNTALHYLALDSRDAELCQALIEKGADIHAKADDGDTPLFIAEVVAESCDDNTFLTTMRSTYARVKADESKANLVDGLGTKWKPSDCKDSTTEEQQQEERQRRQRKM